MLREFILMLRTVVDQLILLLTKGNCESIGKFRNQQENHNQYQNYDPKFLIALNAAANYLKHHPYQFEAASTIFNHAPAQLIMVNPNSKNKEGQHDYRGMFEFFRDKLISQPNNSQVACWIDCHLLVTGFNNFFQELKQQKTD